MVKRVRAGLEKQASSFYKTALKEKNKKPTTPKRPCSAF